MKKADIEIARKQAAEVFAKAGIVMNPDELANIEVADFGLNDVYHTGLLLVTYVPAVTDWLPNLLYGAP